MLYYVRTDLTKMQGETLISPEDAKRRLRELSETPSNGACIILGAGASFGYSDSDIFKPPTVKDLFNPQNTVVSRVIKKKEHQLIDRLSAYLTREIKNHDDDLEKFLSFQYSRQKEDNLFCDLLRYLEDIFFVSSVDISIDDNNYMILINILRGIHARKHWSLISFNYDTILELSYLLTRRDINGRAFGTLNDYIDQNPAILKMHGGINFRYIFMKEREREDISSYTNHTLFSKMMSDTKPPDDFLYVASPSAEKPLFYEERRVKDGATGEYQAKSLFNYPLMLIPIHESVSPENTFFKTHIGLAKHEIEKADLIISIGYNFGDEAFLGALKEIDLSSKEMILVNLIRDAGGITIDPELNSGYLRIKKELPNLKIRIFNGNGFGEFVSAIS